MLTYIDLFDAVNHVSEICSTVYFPGCNMDCEFCFNKDMVLGKSLYSVEMNQIEYLLFGKNDKKLTDIVLTGGEPLIHKDFKSVVSMIQKHNVNSIQVNTNMMNPEMLSWFLQNTDNHIVAFDYKTYQNSYQELIHPKNIEIYKNCKKLFEQSVRILLDSYKQNPFTIQARSTITRFLFLHQEKTILDMAKFIYKNFRTTKGFSWRFQDQEPTLYKDEDYICDLLQNKVKKICKNTTILYGMDKEF